MLVKEWNTLKVVCMFVFVTAIFSVYYESEKCDVVKCGDMWERWSITQSVSHICKKM